MAIEEIADDLPDVQIVVNGTVAAQGGQLAGTIQITNNSFVFCSLEQDLLVLF